MRRVKRVVAVVGASTLMLSVAAFPALANNDPTVPADDASCNSNVVGQPFGGNATDIGPSPVGDDPATPEFDAGPASKDNPGRSTGAKGATASGENSPNRC